MPAQAAIPLATLGAQGILNLLAQRGAARANQKQMELLNQREGDLSVYFGKELNTPFLQTEEAQAILSQINDNYKQSLDNMEANAITGGATAEAKTAAKGEMQDNHSRVLSQLAGYGTQRKDRLAGQYQGLLSDIYNKKFALGQQEGQSWMNYMGNINDAAGNMLYAWGEGGFEDLFGKKAQVGETG